MILEGLRNFGGGVWTPQTPPLGTPLVSVLLRKRNVSDKTCRENQNTDFVFSKFFCSLSCRLWENAEKCGRARQSTDDNIIRRMRIACWTSKALDTHSEYVILLVFSKATRVTRTFLHVKFPVLFIPRYVFRRQGDRTGFSSRFDLSLFWLALLTLNLKMEEARSFETFMSVETVISCDNQESCNTMPHIDKFYWLVFNNILCWV